MLNSRERRDLSPHLFYVGQAVVSHAKFLVLALRLKATVIPFKLYLSCCVAAMCAGASQSFGWLSQPFFPSVLLPDLYQK